MRPAIWIIVVAAVLVVGALQPAAPPPIEAARIDPTREPSNWVCPAGAGFA